MGDLVADDQAEPAQFLFQRPGSVVIIAAADPGIDIDGVFTGHISGAQLTVFDLDVPEHAVVLHLKPVNLGIHFAPVDGFIRFQQRPAFLL